MDGRDDRRGARALSVAVRPLDARRPYKPLDIGNGIVAGSLTPGGRWLELGIAHPRHGRVVLTDAPRFTASTADQRAVRVYRASLASREREGFGLAVPPLANVALVEDSFPLATHEIGRTRIEIVTFAPPGARGAVQIARVSGDANVLSSTGTPRLSRAAYTQLTPGGALPPVAEQPRTGAEDGVIWIADDALEAAAAIALANPAEATVAFAIALALSRDEALATATALVQDAETLWERTRERRHEYWQGVDLGPGDEVARRGVAYAVDCAASRLSSVAVLADHVILPLVWTRDAYYVCRMLLAVDRAAASDVVLRFLRWCFEVAERPDGWWPRASLASGQAKDPVFQLDQQLYPLLLLEDYARLIRDRSRVTLYAAERDAVVRALLAKRSSNGLIATAETPADDPIEAPYHFSSHVLLWRVLRDLDRGAADDLRSATLRHFASGDLFAYAVRDAGGDGAVRYHDANDLPTIFAPGWGFCDANDPRWRATVAFAWSTANRAFVDGPLGGLGSVHTLHPWPLGDLQDLLVGRITHDPSRVERAEERLRRVSTWDAMLPEAYDARSGDVASRHWFAWPTALRALLQRDPALVAP